MQTAAATTPGTKDPTYLLTLLHEVRSLSLNALDDMRSLIEILRADAESPAINPVGWPQLPDLLAQFRRLGTDLTVTGDLTQQPLPAEASAAAYHTVRECLYNAVRHAPGQPVTLHICAAPTQVRIAVSNPTKSDGGPDMGSSGYGLIGLEERVRLCGGHVESEHTAGIWRTCVVLPTAGATALEVSP